jgi:hypothetical protein
MNTVLIENSREIVTIGGNTSHVHRTCIREHRAGVHRTASIGVQVRHWEALRSASHQDEALITQIPLTICNAKAI